MGFALLGGCGVGGGLSWGEASCIVFCCVVVAMRRRCISYYSVLQKYAVYIVMYY